MAQQVGKGFTIHLTASLMAGTKALEELCFQGHISTMNWYNLEVEPIDNNSNYSDANRNMTFTLKNKQRVEVEVTSRKLELGDIVDIDEGRSWESYVVWVEKNNRMNCLINDLGNKFWYRCPMDDKPLSGTTWRVPTLKEIVVYIAAVENHNEGNFLKVYYSDLIDWNYLNSNLSPNTQWVREALLKRVM